MGPLELVAGIDTHKEAHVVVVLDALGRFVASESFSATDAGSRRLLGWLSGLGSARRAGVEGTGSFGYRLTRALQHAGVQVTEVCRPDRSRRRRRGKNDLVDAEAAARAVLALDATAVPKDRSGPVGELRALVVARRSAVKARTQAGQQLTALLLDCDDATRKALQARTARESAAVAPDSAAPAGCPTHYAASPAAGSTSPKRSANSTSTSPPWSAGPRPGCWNDPASAYTPPPSC